MPLKVVLELYIKKEIAFPFTWSVDKVFLVQTDQNFRGKEEVQGILVISYGYKEGQGVRKGKDTAFKVG